MKEKTIRVLTTFKIKYENESDLPEITKRITKESVFKVQSFGKDGYYEIQRMESEVFTTMPPLTRGGC